MGQVGVRVWCLNYNFPVPLLLPLRFHSLAFVGQGCRPSRPQWYSPRWHVATPICVQPKPRFASFLSLRLGSAWCLLAAKASRNSCSTTIYCCRRPADKVAWLSLSVSCVRVQGLRVSGRRWVCRGARDSSLGEKQKNNPLPYAFFLDSQLLNEHNKSISYPNLAC